MFKPFLTMAFLAMSSVTLPCVALAADLAQPTGEVILSVTGSITSSNSEGVANFDETMLRALGTVDISTSTVWTDGVHKYTGVPLKTLVDALGVTGESLSMFAVNDYKVEVPMSDAVEGGPILAFEMDGKPMSLRDKGPIWLIYPFDTNSAYRSEEVYSRSIWQLTRIEAKS